jgi:hypothetical protein
MRYAVFTDGKMDYEQRCYSAIEQVMEPELDTLLVSTRKTDDSLFAIATGLGLKVERTKWPLKACDMTICFYEDEKEYHLVSNRGAGC